MSFIGMPSSFVPQRVGQIGKEAILAQAVRLFAVLISAQLVPNFCHKLWQNWREQFSRRLREISTARSGHEFGRKLRRNCCSENCHRL
jgi:hypothetical protein